MKKPPSRIREEIAKLQDQLKSAETKEAERIGRLALKAGLGEIEVDEEELVAGLKELAARFRKGGNGKTAKPSATATVPSGPLPGPIAEA